MNVIHAFIFALNASFRNFLHEFKRKKHALQFEQQTKHLLDEIPF